ncbi:MAG: S8 family serine peptidase [Dehalococcoidia bacterium]|nr:S8 family serine peptidase [Dehalococcoidia bacterium]
MAKKYPEEITIGKIKFSKSPNELYFELKPELTKEAADKFLSTKTRLIQWQFKPTDRKALALQKYNKSSAHSKWVTCTKGQTVDQLIGQFETDKSVSIASPVYFRKDLKGPNGFTFSDQIIIRLDKNTSEKDLKKLFGELGVEQVRGPRGALGKDLMLLRVLDKKKQNTYEVAQQLANSKIIQSAKVDMIQLHEGYTAIPNDTYYLSQWNLNNTGQTMSDGAVGTAGCDINVEQAWDISKGSPLVVIAILDSGCDLSHPDLFSHYVQSDRWYDAETGTNNPFDYYRHGTCCAGIASAVTNSLTSQGVAGVGWHCRIMPVRLEGGTGFTEAKLLNSLNHALNNHANVISMSWGWGGDQTDMDDCFQECIDAGIVLVAASGNSGAASISYPASNPNVIAVGATNENDRRCTAADWGGGGSQHGPELSVVAPGVHTWSTDRQGAVGYAPGDYYEDFGGTSGATPHVAGLAGLILAYNPTLTPAQVRTIIENTADDMVGNPAEDVAGWDEYMGHGRINAHAAIVDVQTNHPYIPADVYIRDSLTDTGVEPYPGWDLCNSPDIIIRKHQVPTPQITFADMTVDPGSDIVEIGNDNYIYVRVHNKGTTTTNIHTRVYFAPIATTCAPDLWQYIGQADFYDVTAGTSAVSDAIVWEDVPDPSTGGVDHFCLIGSIEGYRDPHPDPAGISNASLYMEFMKNHNNICYRNVWFEDSYLDAFLSEKFLVAGIAEGEKYDIRIEKAALALRADIDIKLPLEVVKKPRILLDNAIERQEKPVRGLRAFKLNAGKEAVIKGAIFAPHSRNLAQLDIKFPADAKPGEEYKVVVQQIFQGQPIGAFQIIGKIVDPKKVRFTGIRGAYLVHHADCKHLGETNKQMWVPFESLEAAKSAGYDMALDCLNQPFTTKEVSYRLSRKVLYFINKVELAEDLNQAVKSKLGAAYFEARYGKEAAKKKDYSIGIDTALKLLEARDTVRGFKKLEEIEAVKGVGKDNLIDLVNAFK